ncbi:MAG: DnaD domain protein [Oscillospiraceae bacterium]|nr:DnaD domain protein [Oscillospiraceae bacterium]
MDANDAHGFHHDRRTDILRQKLSIPRYAALGLLEALGQFAAEYIPGADFAAIDPALLIARAAAWDGDPEAFIPALQESGLLSRTFCLLCGGGGGSAAPRGAPQRSFGARAARSAAGTAPAAAAALPPVKPGSAEIAQLLQSEPEAAAFFAEAQKVIGTFGHPETASLVMAHDYYGLSWSVLLVLLHSVRGIDSGGGVKIATKTYESYAKKLYNAGVSTAEDAERFFVSYSDIPKLFRLLSTKWGLSNSKPTPAQREKLERWTSWGFSEEMIDIAYRTALDKPAKQPFLFADKVLSDWQENGIFTPEDVAKSRAEWVARLRFKPPEQTGGQGSAWRKPNQATVYDDAPPPNHSLDKAEALARRGRRTLPKKAHE